MLKAFEAALLLLQVIRTFMDYLAKQKLLNDDRKARLAEELLKVAAAGQAAKAIRDKVGKMTDAEIDAALGDDFRD